MFEVSPTVELVEGGAVIRATSYDDKWGSCTLRFEWVSGKSEVVWD